MKNPYQALGRKPDRYEHSCAWTSLVASLLKPIDPAELISQGRESKIKIRTLKQQLSYSPTRPLRNNVVLLSSPLPLFFLPR